MATRRSVLALLGIGSVSAPLAAKAAAEAEIAKLAGITTALTPAGMGGPPSQASTIGPNGGLKWLPWEERTRLVAAYAKTFGILSVMEDDFRDRAKSISQLDLDIASKKSWSLAAKIHEQRRRNYDRLIADLETRPAHVMKRQALEKLFGFELPW